MNEVKTATLVKTHPQRRNEEHIQFGLAALYRLSDPLQYDADKPPCSFLFVSTSAPLGRWETYAFPADETGDCLSWAELCDSEKEVRDHGRVIRNLGHELVEAAA